MYTVEVEYFLRLVLLLTRAALPALRDYVNKNHKKKSVHDFLRDKTGKIDGLKDKMTPLQWHQLKEGSDKEVDISKWDISVLSCIPLYLFKDLAPADKKAIECIRSVKNTIQSHTPSGRITRKVVEQKFKELTREINNLCSGPEFSQQERRDLQESFRSVDEDELDISSITTELRSKFTNEDFLERVVQIFEDSKRNIDGKLTDIAQAVNDGFCNLKEELKSHASNGNNNIVTVLVGRLRVEGNNPVKVAKTAAKLAEETNTAVSGSPEASIQNELNGNVKKLIAMFETTGAVVKGARLGCVLIEIECPTVQAVIDAWECFESQEMQHHLNQIALFLSSEINDDIKISAFIPLESIERVLRDVEKNAVYNAEVEIVLECHNKDEALHILDIFEGGSADEEIKRIAKDLSDEVEVSISLSTFLHDNNPEIIPEQKQSPKELSPTDSSLCNVDDICEIHPARQLHQTKYGSERVRVDDLPRQKMSHSDDQKTDLSNPDKLTSLWVGNVTKDISGGPILLHAFSRFGLVKSIHCLPHKYCAFVNYEHPDAAVHAMKNLQGVRLGRYPLKIRFPDKPIDTSNQWGFSYIFPLDEHYMQSRRMYEAPFNRSVITMAPDYPQEVSTYTTKTGTSTVTAPIKSIQHLAGSAVAKESRIKHRLAVDKDITPCSVTDKNPIKSDKEEPEIRLSRRQKKMRHKYVHSAEQKVVGMRHESFGNEDTGEKQWYNVPKIVKEKDGSPKDVYDVKYDNEESETKVQCDR